MPKINKEEMIEELGPNEVPLKHNNNAYKEDCHKSVNLYNVPKKWVTAIKKKGYTFVSFAKIAIEEKLKKEGLLKD